MIYINNKFNIMYFIIKRENNSKIIGTDFPQAWKFTKEYKKECDDANGIYSFFKRIQKNERPDFMPNLGGFILSGRAKLTNIVSTTIPMLHMDNEAKEVFSVCNLGDSEFYKAQLYIKQRKIFTQILDYYYLCSFIDILDYIYFPGTIFRHEINLVEKQNVYVTGLSSFSAYEEYWQQNNKGLIYPQTITLKEGFDKTLDYFIIPKLNIFYGIASEKLKTMIEDNGITGLRFEPIEIIFK